MKYNFRGDVKIPTYKQHTDHKKPSVCSHTLAPTTICDLSHSVCWSPLTDLGHISSFTYACHPLWFICGHRKGILTSPLKPCMDTASNLLVIDLQLDIQIACDGLQEKFQHTEYFTCNLLISQSILIRFSNSFHCYS